jgi:hypothetical protein
MYPKTPDGRPINEIEGMNWLRSFLDMVPPEATVDDDANRAEYERMAPLHNELITTLPDGVYIWVDELACDAIQDVINTNDVKADWPIPREGFVSPAWMVFAKPLWMTDEDDPAKTRWTLHSTGHHDNVMSLHAMRTATTPPSIEYLHWTGDLTSTVEENRMWSAAVLQLFMFSVAAAVLELKGEVRGERIDAARLRSISAHYAKAGVKTTVPALGMVRMKGQNYAVDADTQHRWN